MNQQTRRQRLPRAVTSYGVAWENLSPDERIAVRNEYPTISEGMFAVLKWKRDE